MTSFRQVSWLAGRNSSPPSQALLHKAQWQLGEGLAETAGLLTYAYACFTKSSGLFDITSGLLRKAWDFSSARLPESDAIAALMPHIGLDKIEWDTPRLTFKIPGMEIDFGRIGKEYAVDRAASVCAALGIQHGLVDLGGDIRLIGPHPDGTPWRIGVRHPRKPAVPIAEVALVSGALATSGDYERFIEVNVTPAGTKKINAMLGFCSRF